MREVLLGDWVNDTLKQRGGPIPKFLYKFYSMSESGFGRINLRDLIVNETVFLSGRKQFNDLLDSCTALSFSDPSKWVEILNESARRVGLDAEQAKNFVDAKLASPDSLVIASKKSIEKSLDSLGICCFTEAGRSLVQWAHYADGHKGVVVELACDVGSGFGALPIRYDSKFPVVDLHTQSPGDVFIPVITKHVDWSPEREWRIVKHGMNGKIHSLPAGCVRRIVLGIHASPDTERFVRACLAERNSANGIRIDVAKAVLADDDFAVVF